MNFKDILKLSISPEWWFIEKGWRIISISAAKDKFLILLEK